MTDRVEDELRAMLHGRAASVSDGHDPVAGVETGVRRALARRRLAVTAGVPLVVVAVVAVSSLLPGAHRHQVTGGVAAATSTVPPTVAPVRTAAAGVPSPSGPSISPVAPAQPSLPPVTTSPPTTLLAPETAQVEVFRKYLENDPAAHAAAVASAGYGGRSYCALRVLDQTSRFVDLETYCQEYYLKDGALAQGSSGLVPVRLAYSGTGAATRVTGIAVPHDGHDLLPELKALFTARAYSRWLRFYDGELANPGFDQTVAQLEARAKQDAVTRRLVPGNNTAR